MSLKTIGLQYKTIKETPIASIRVNITSRDELPIIINKLVQTVPKKIIIGSVFTLFHFTSSFREGSDVEVGVPISQSYDSGEIKTRLFPEIEVLSITQNGRTEIREGYGKLFGFAEKHGIISHEFCREVYLDLKNAQEAKIELQFVIHNWNRLFKGKVKQILDEKHQEKILYNLQKLTLESSAKERVENVKSAVENLQKVSTDQDFFEILSGCAHRFPVELIEQIKCVYEDKLVRTNDHIAAVDAVRDYMTENAPWGRKPLRLGNTLFVTKRPQNPKDFENATNDLEKKKAYCFCPIVRQSLDHGIKLPVSFCYCSAGWFRQQWEGVLGKPVQVDIVQSILIGNDVCQFAIHLPDF